MGNLTLIKYIDIIYERYNFKLYKKWQLKSVCNKLKFK